MRLGFKVGTIFDVSKLELTEMECLCTSTEQGKREYALDNDKFLFAIQPVE